MSRAQQLVTRLLESDPDEFDPKAELMRVDPDTVHWLERNGFQPAKYEQGWWHKEVSGFHFNVRWPLWGEEETKTNGWTVSSIHHGEPFYNLSGNEVKQLLVSWGVAQP
jgi:hypothetical protein